MEQYLLVSCAIVSFFIISTFLTFLCCCISLLCLHNITFELNCQYFSDNSYNYLQKNGSNPESYCYLRLILNYLYLFVMPLIFPLLKIKCLPCSYSFKISSIVTTVFFFFVVAFMVILLL